MISFDLSSKVKEILTTNSVKKIISTDNRKYEVVFTAPGPGVYNQQWFWDSCFHSIVWSNMGYNKRAVAELESLVIGKKEKEFFPHMIFWKQKKDKWWFFTDRLFPSKQYSELIQPPIIGYSLFILSKNGWEFNKEDRLITNTNQHYQYLLKTRDPEKTGLISIVHPWESGLDSLPSYDLELKDKPFFGLKARLRFRKLLMDFKKRYFWEQEQICKYSSFRIKDVLTNSLLAFSLKNYAEVLKKLGLDDLALQYDKKSSEITQSLIKYCWNNDKKIFFDLDVRTDKFKQIEVKTVGSLTPLLLDIPAVVKNSLIKHLINPREYWLPYPIPSVAADESTFSPTEDKLLWRGPTWVNTNFLIWLGLNKQKEFELAGKVAERTIAIIKKSGFREFYNPFTGKGMGAKSFGWSTLVYSMNKKTKEIFL
ncbi:MAG: hypothetical protein K9W46_03200 [Candidatus Heimdallarchaeum endolithica]|uniref:Mannosylglycerate hydrolase MGH1-like glycoside hydrolase domain-containing protein n=1 Tax=Candidatus Heimdallarchaeum endolithica TaxID=2876572 RepID=A0A9Y1BTQ2_9ARCH|nr:MAG: hypothetical protein K9W46_03200 [Candidatus Heimdallarchaeum endolithica]